MPASLIRVRMVVILPPPSKHTITSFFCVLCSLVIRSNKESMSIKAVGLSVSNTAPHSSLCRASSARLIKRSVALLAQTVVTGPIPPRPAMVASNRSCSSPCGVSKSMPSSMARCAASSPGPAPLPIMSNEPSLTRRALVITEAAAIKSFRRRPRTAPVRLSAASSTRSSAPTECSVTTATGLLRPVARKLLRNRVGRPIFCKYIKMA